MHENRLQQLFNSGKQNLLSIFFTAGYPTLDSTLGIAETLERSGADFLEIGFPYSDPVADGPVNQHSSQMALQNGMSLNVLFDQLAALRERVSIPVLLMGYFNPVVQYGVERFCKKAAEVGVDGVILPDLPMYEYEALYARYFKENNVCNIFMVTPQTSAERIQKIDSLSNSFIYLLSASIITGSSIQQSDNIEAYYQRVKQMNLKNPAIFGFGITDKPTFGKACSYGRGAIIGSRFVKLLGEEDYLEKIPGFIKAIKD